MQAVEAVAAEFEAIHQFPARLSTTQALNPQIGTPAAAVELLSGGGAPQSHDFGAEKGGVLRQGHAQVLFKQRIGVEHQFLGQPLQVAVVGELGRHHLAGPAAVGLHAAAADRAVHLLGRHAGDQAAAALPQSELDAELVAAHQTAGGVQEGQFTAAVLATLGAHQFERCTAAALMAAAAGSVAFEIQLAASVPGVRPFHRLTLGLCHPRLGSKGYQTRLNPWAGSRSERWSAGGRRPDRVGAALCRRGSAAS